MKKIITYVYVLVAVLALILVAVWYTSTQWTRDFDLRYVEFVSSESRTDGTDYSYYLYEITNNTHRTLKDVHVVISVDDVGKDFKYEDYVESSIYPGETIEYRLYIKDYQEAAEEQGVNLILVDTVEIVKIKYSK